MTIKGNDAVTIREITLSVDNHERPARPELTEGSAFYAGDDDDAA